MDEDREGCDQGLECLVERIWGFLETVEKGRGIEQAGVQGVQSGQMWGVGSVALDQGSSKDCSEFAQGS